MQSACHLVARKRDDALRLQIFSRTQEEAGFIGILRKSITFLSCSAHKETLSEINSALLSLSHQISVNQSFQATICPRMLKGSHHYN